jgi:predicted amidophosphoribosyltransferase
VTVYWDSREPYSCNRCGTPQSFHGCGDHPWEKPKPITVQARMVVRQKDPQRWIPWGDQRIHYRKWKS